MTVYVDDTKVHVGRSVCCYMFADSPNELHAMAKAIGLGRFAFQTGGTLAHYNVCLSKRAQAVRLGAVEVDSEWRRARIRQATRVRAA